MGIKDWLKKAKVAVAVGKTISSGKQAKTFDKIERGEEIASKAMEIADLLGGLFGKKK